MKTFACEIEQIRSLAIAGKTAFCQGRRRAQSQAWTTSESGVRSLFCFTSETSGNWGLHLEFPHLPLLERLWISASTEDLLDGQCFPSLKFLAGPMWLRGLHLLRKKMFLIWKPKSIMRIPMSASEATNLTDPCWADV